MLSQKQRQVFQSHNWSSFDPSYPVIQSDSKAAARSLTVGTGPLRESSGKKSETRDFWLGQKKKKQTKKKCLQSQCEEATSRDGNRQWLLCFWLINISLFACHTHTNKANPKRSHSGNFLQCRHCVGEDDVFIVEGPQCCWHQEIEQLA